MPRSSAFALTLCLLAGCPTSDAGKHDVVAVSGAASTLSSPRMFESAQPLVPVTHSSLVPRVTTLGSIAWPRAARAAARPGARTVSGHWCFQPFNDVTIHSHLGEVDGRRFFFFSRLTRKTGSVMDANHSKGHTLAWIELDADGADEVLLDDVTADFLANDLEFEVVSFDDRIEIVYAAGLELYRIVASIRDDTLGFGAPQLVHATAGFVTSLRAIADGNDLHLLWAEKHQAGRYETRLLYARAMARPEVITETANSTGANMIVNGNAVVIAWLDHRLRRRQWDYWEDADEIFVRQSTDGGRSFGTPVHVQRDRPERALRLFVVPTAAELVIYWSTDNQHHSWQTILLARDLAAARTGPNVAAGALELDYATRLTATLSAPGEASGIARAADGQPRRRSQTYVEAD